MDSIDHEDVRDINDLTQYCIAFADQLRKMKELHPDIDTDRLGRAADGLARVSRRMAGNVDNRIYGGAKVNDPKTNIISAVIIGAAILVGAYMICSSMTVDKAISDGIERAERIAILEEKVGFLEDHDMAMEAAKDKAYNNLIGGN